MGLMNLLTGRRPAPGGVARQPASALRERMMAVNRDTAPFEVRDGGPEGCDLVAEWKIVNAKWYEFFAKAGVERVFKILMRFDEASGEVRAVDQEWSVEWRAGTPTLSIAASAFRGRKWESSYEKVYAFREDGSFGEVYEYAFRTDEMKKPLIAAAHAAGWGWKGVAFGKF
jgi:hypothetical protein